MKRSTKIDDKIKRRANRLTRRELIENELANMSRAEKALCKTQKIPYPEFAKHCADQLRKLYR